MTIPQVEHLISKQYKIRKKRLQQALSDGATRTQKPVQSNRDKCAICLNPERGGGLITYRNRDGSEILVGERCASYLNYLTANPNKVKSLLR